MPHGPRFLAPLFGGFDVKRFIPPPPEIEGLPGDAEVPAGLGGFFVETIILHPLEPFLGPGERLGSEARDMGSREDISVYAGHASGIPAGGRVRKSS